VGGSGLRSIDSECLICQAHSAVVDGRVDGPEGEAAPAIAWGHMESPSSTELCVLSVHAHPDDEASKGAATMAHYGAEGIRTVLVTCTGGEAGDILNPAADTPEVRADLAAVRRRELDEAVRIIGYDALYLLGYRDSGMPDTEANAHPDTFGNADLDEATGRLVEIVRKERPQVIVGYARDRVYAHPDHVRVHEISVLAFERTGDPEWYPELGEPWQPLKLYYSNGFTRERIRALHEWFLSQGDESPLAKWVEHMDERDAKAAEGDAEADETGDGHDDALEIVTSTRVDVRDQIEVGRAALLAHHTQIPADSFFFRVPLEVEQELHPWEEYVLARSLVDPGVPEGAYETDLVAGLRVVAKP
jgi:mycothiol S-conjugate amidase